jgi:hypothetical protein
MPDDLAGPKTHIHEALDRTELRNLRNGVPSLAIVVAHGLRKAVSALPHPKHVLGEAGFALDRADVEGKPACSVGGVIAGLDIGFAF